MSSWPEFTNEPLDGNRAWSATFDSYEERRDDVYYVVTLSDGGQVVGTFMAAVSAAFSSDDCPDSEVAATLRKRIGQVAATGKANTSYRGPVMRR
jgi:hypothetical protein